MDNKGGRLDRDKCQARENSGGVKAPANEETLLRKHCFPKYFLGAQTSRKQKIVLLPCCANEETFAEESKCFWKIFRNIFASREANLASATNVACARKQGKHVSATMFPRLRRPLGPGGQAAGAKRGKMNFCVVRKKACFWLGRMHALIYQFAVVCEQKIIFLWIV